MVGRRCQICDGAHQTFQCTKSVNETVKKPPIVNIDTGMVNVNILRARIAELEAENAVLKGGRVSRKEYMKEYMRKRRAKSIGEGG